MRIVFSGVTNSYSTMSIPPPDPKPSVSEYVASMAEPGSIMPEAVSGSRPAPKTADIVTNS